MSMKQISLFVAVVFAIGAVPANAIVMNFYQLDWLDDSGVPGSYIAQDSDWGRVEIGLSSADDYLFHPMTLPGEDFYDPSDDIVGRGGYINIVTNSSGSGDAWDIYNLPIFYEDPAELDGRLPQGALFDLGITSGAVDVTGLNYGYTITPTPLSTTGSIPIGSSISAPVVPYEILVGGDNLYFCGELMECGGKTTPPKAKDLKAVESNEQVSDRASIAIAEKDVAAVNEDKNGCAPGSVARSIKYMADANSNVTVSANANTVYGDLKTAMGTTASGTKTSNILSGKNTYVKNNNLPIISTQTNSFKKAIKTLKDKGDVEIGIRWGSKDGKSLGAHRAFVSEVQEITDAAGNVTGYVVKTIDDPKQGDGTAANKTHTARFDANGKLIQYDGAAPTGTGAGLINFQTENVHASTAVIEFWGLTTTVHVSPGGYVSTPLGDIKIPVGRPGETTSRGAIKIHFEGAESGGVVVGSELVANPEGLPDPTSETIDMDVNLDLDPMNPIPTVRVRLNLEHVKEDGSTGQMVPVVPGEDEVFLENLVVGSDFFDITYQVSTADGVYEDGDGCQLYRLHGEIDEQCYLPIEGEPGEFFDSVWFTDLGEGDFAVDSFFDVFFDIEITPQAYEELGLGMKTLVNLELTAVETDDLMPGDANDDGFIDEEDIAILAENWLRDGNVTWFDGDFNGDHVVDDRDATLLASNWNPPELPEASVPEPTAIVLLLAGGLCIIAHRGAWQKQRR